MEPIPFAALVHGHRYDTTTAVLLADDAYWDGRSAERDGRNRFLFRTRLRGLYFVLCRSLRGGESDWIDPLTREEAVALWEDLPQRNVAFSEAFPTAVAPPDLKPLVITQEPVAAIEQEEPAVPLDDANVLGLVEEEQPSIDTSAVAATVTPVVEPTEAEDALRALVMTRAVGAADARVARTPIEFDVPVAKADATPPPEAKLTVGEASKSRGKYHEPQRSRQKPIRARTSPKSPGAQKPPGSVGPSGPALWLDDRGEWQTDGVVRHRSGKVRLQDGRLVITYRGVSGLFRKTEWTRDDVLELAQIVSATVLPGPGSAASLRIMTTGSDTPLVELHDCRPLEALHALVDAIEAAQSGLAAEATGDG